MRFYYGAKSSNKQRRIIAKLEVTSKGPNPRFIVANVTGDAQSFYDNIYCARGDKEKRIKEQQPGLFADRTSAHKWWSKADAIFSINSVTSSGKLTSSSLYRGLSPCFLFQIEYYCLSKCFAVFNNAVL